ncbi:conjugal transfer protein TraI, partial [Mesorhizobium sp. M5C.F.Ca.IN.020.14.1.1]
MSKTGAGTESDLPSSTRETANAMRLRPEPPRVTRISRRVLAGVGLFAGLGIGCALIYALQNADRQPGQEELFTTDRRQTADGLQGLPSDYSGIPQLGPPLPGDLGGPI